MSLCLGKCLCTELHQESFHQGLGVSQSASSGLLKTWLHSILTEGEVGIHLSVKWVLCANWVILALDRGSSDNFLWFFVFLRYLHQKIGLKMSHGGYIVLWFSIPVLGNWDIRVLYLLSLRGLIDWEFLMGHYVSFLWQIYLWFGPI